MLKFIRFIKFIILASSPFGYPNGNFFTKDTLRPDETADNLPYEKVGKNEPMCIADEVPFDIPESWEWCRLSVVAQLLDGKKINGESHPYLEAKYLRGRAIPTIKTSGKYVIKNTKVILVDGENSGEVFNLSESGYLGSTFKVLYSTSEVYTDYLLLFILLQKQFLRQNKVGAAIPHLNKNIFFSLLFPLPPYEEQIRIVEQYNALIPFVDNYGVLENKLDILNASFPELLKKSILQEAVQGKLVPQDPNDEPASVLLERIRDEKQALINAGKIKKDKNESVIFRRDNSHYEKLNGIERCIDDEIQFDIPDNWEWITLKMVAISSLGKTLDKAKNQGEFKPYLCSINVYWSGINLSTVKEARFEKDELSKYCLKEGDLLICEGGDVGRSAIWRDNREMYYQNALHRVRFFGGISPDYFHMILECYKNNKILEENSKGMTIKHLVQSSLNSIYFPLPPLKEQHRIVATYRSILPALEQL